MMRLVTLHRSLGLLAWSALLIGLACISLGERRVDLWWQLADGRTILQTHQLPTHVATAFGFSRQPFVDEYSLYELSLALLEKMGGLSAIHAAFIATYFLIFTIPLAAARSLRRDLLSLILLALAGVFVINRYEQRPEIGSVLLFTVLIFVLVRAQEFSVRLLIPLALLFAIWTNVHSSYLFGLLALVLCLVERIAFAPREVQWTAGAGALTFGTACVATLVNPYGWHRILFTFAQENDLGSNLLSREMWPVWDQPLRVQVLMAITAIALGSACFRRRNTGGWLIALAWVLFVFTQLHIRHMSFLAVTLLALYAYRPNVESDRRWHVPQTIGLALAGTVLLLFTAFAAHAGFLALRAGEAMRNRGFVPELVHLIPPGRTVLSHDAEGAFLTYAGQGALRPLIDSGQGRFSDATKRFYFFAVQNPQAFDEALQSLQVDDIVATRSVMHWMLALDRPGHWKFIEATRDGALFERSPEIGPPLNAPGALELLRLSAQAEREGDLLQAFCLRAPVDHLGTLAYQHLTFNPSRAPVASLEILDRVAPDAISEPFLLFLNAWLDRTPADGLREFSRTHPRLANPLLAELLLSHEQANGPLLPASGPTLQRLARVLTLLRRHDSEDARALLATVRPPDVSPFYYSLRGQLDATASSSAAQRWQTWPGDGDSFFTRFLPTLPLHGQR